MHLSAHLTTPSARPAVVASASDLIREEIARTSGASGMAVRSAYRLVTGIRPEIVSQAVDSLLDPFADGLDPFYQEHTTTGRPLADILAEQRTSMAEALLAVTDERAARTKHVRLRDAYRRVRSHARVHVEEASAGVAALVTAHTPPLDDPRA